MIFQSLTFWTLVAGLVAFVARFYFPAFPLDETTILAAVLFVLGLIGIYPTLHLKGVRALLLPDIVHSLAFWQLVAGFVVFVLHFFAPNFPFDQTIILGFILFVLGLVGIVPELRVRGLRK